jgi:Mn2+/Fe2+ NRAMP family transporter
VAPGGPVGGKWYRTYILWLTFPPMVMMFLGKPVYLILAYGVLGAFFMPFLSVTLLWLLNTDRVPREWRNKLPSNIAMVLCAAAFIALAVNELQKAVRGA